MSQTAYKPGINKLDLEPAAAVKETASQYISTHERAEVFEEAKPQSANTLSINPSPAAITIQKPDFSNLKSTVSEQSWHDFQKIDLGEAPSAPVYISDAEFAAREEQQQKETAAAFVSEPVTPVTPATPLTPLTPLTPVASAAPVNPIDITSITSVTPEPVQDAVPPPPSDIAILNAAPTADNTEKDDEKSLKDNEKELEALNNAMSSQEKHTIFNA